MRIVALCPTYRRKRLLENLVACFEAQTHPDSHLLICDDSGELAPQRGQQWDVLASPRFPTLPAKYNMMAHMACRYMGADAVAVMEDDDVYLPQYLAKHAAALDCASGSAVLWSHCAWVWTDGSGGPGGGSLRREETGHARLHGCLALTRGMFEQIGGWPATPRMDFDLQMLAACRRVAPARDPCGNGALSQYYFRWASTGAPHGQAYCSGPGDEQWLEKAQAAIDASQGAVIPGAVLTPRMDKETELLMQQRHLTGGL